MSLAEKIAAIHAERERQASDAGDIGARLSEIGAALGHIDRLRLDLLGRVEDDALDRLLAWEVPLREIAERITREQAALELVLARLSRPTLNIGMVGRARQGKSQFLQSLTGLTSQEIPAGAGRFCTGAPSMIEHVPGDHTYADVLFHTAKEFLGEVIGPYYERLGLGAPPVTVEEFGDGRLPVLPAGVDPDAQSAYGHLATYHEAFKQYKQLIGAIPLRVGAEKIRSFVAQDDESGQRIHAFRAVRRVHIATAFPNSDLSRIGVIDLPGLGDTNLGDSRVLLAALCNDVDIVLFLRRPAAEGDGIHDFDVALYGMAQSALPEIPMARRSFLILNHRRSADQDNLAMAEEFSRQIADSPIRVADTTIVDCSEPGEVAGAFEQVVNYLVANIAELDRLLLAERTRHAAEIHRDASELAREFATLGVLAQPSGLWFPVFQELFDKAYKDLSAGVEKLVRAYRAERDRPSEPLAEAIAAALDRAREDTGIPSPPEIGMLFDLYGERITAYGILLDELRAHLSRHFLDLDTALHECVQRMWQQVADVLRDAAQLGPLSDEAGRDFLLTLAERVPPGVREDGASEVRYALQILTDFDLSYRSFIQHRIRPCLDRMHAGHPEIPFPQDGSPPDENTVWEMLDSTYKRALFKCESELRNLLADPNRAVFGIVEEFRDRILRSRGIQKEWRAIYLNVRAEIWADQLAALAEKTVHLRTWNEAVQKLSALLRGGATQQADIADTADSADTAETDTAETR